MTREINLTRGYQAIVDDDDFERFGDVLWQAVGRAPYIYASHAWRDGVGEDAPVRKRYLHREIAGAGPGVPVRPINGNPLDCRRENLRLCK